MISEESYKLIKRIATYSPAMVETECRDRAEFERAEKLSEDGYLIKETVLPPGKEPRYPFGLVSYRPSTAGYDVCEEYANSKRQKDLDCAEARRDRKQRIRREYLIALIGIAGSFFVQHYDKIMSLIVKAFHCIRSFFH